MSPFILYSDGKGNIFEDTSLYVVGRSGWDALPVPEDEWIQLPDGGQLYELIAGHDRFIADLRPLLGPVMAKRGLPQPLCCHPYDVCTELIARESGVIVTDHNGDPLKAPLKVEPDVAWAGYANQHIRAQIEPLLQTALKKRGW